VRPAVRLVVPPSMLRELVNRLLIVRSKSGAGRSMSAAA